MKDVFLLVAILNSFLGTGVREAVSLEGVNENDGSFQLDPLVCLVYQMFPIFVDFCNSGHHYT